MKTRNPLSLVLAVIAAVMVLLTIILGILCLTGFLRSSEPEPTLPPTEPPTDPIPSDTAESGDETSVTSDEATTAPPKKGCASSVTSLSILLASLAAPLMIQKKSCPKRRKL